MSRRAQGGLALGALLLGLAAALPPAARAQESFEERLDAGCFRISNEPELERIARGG